MSAHAEFTSPPRDVLFEEWARPKSWAEWHRYYAEPIPVLKQLQQFAVDTAYFSRADLEYLAAGLLAEPDAATLDALNYTAEHVGDDPVYLATLWLSRAEMSERAGRWAVQARARVALQRGAA